MGFRSSFRWRSVELNDGVTFLLDTRGSNLDDPNPAEATYATRKSNTPVVTATMLRETTIVLNFHLVARAQADYEASIQILKRLFAPDGRDYLLERRRPSEQYHKYLMAGARALNFNLTERRASVTLQTSDMTWQDAAEQMVETEAFDESTITEPFVVNYAGSTPVEPIIEFTTLSASSAGPTPLYYHNVTLWYWSPTRVSGHPLKLVQGWNVSGIIAAEKMRSDAADISITTEGGWQLDHYRHRRNDGTLDLWVRSPFWIDYGAPVLGNREGRTFGQPQIDAAEAAPFFIPIRVSATAPTPFPTTGSLRIGEELFWYDSAERVDPYSVRVRIAARALNGTPATAHKLYDPVLTPITFKINFGYSTGFETAFPAVTGDNWPALNYGSSNNEEWIFDQGVTRAFSATSGQPPNGLNWRPEVGPNIVPRLFVSPALAGSAAYTKGTFVTNYPVSGNPGATRLVLDHAGGSSQRVITAIKLDYTQVAGSRFRLRAIRAGFGAANEYGDTLGTYLAISNGNVSTGWVATNAWDRPATHFVVEVDGAPTGIQQVFVLNSFSVRWDNGDTYFVPYVQFDSVERGPGTGEYPVWVTIKNQDDWQQTDPFLVSARMVVNETGYIDCKNHTVSGALTLREVSYKQPTWLRLLPGQNIFQIAAKQGTGRVRVRLRYRNRY